MKVSSEEGRRRRYVPTPPARPCSLTPTKVELLRWIGELRLATLPQLARLACPSEKSARRHCRTLFDNGLVTILPTARCVLADPMAAKDPSLLFGSAPNIYTLTRAGARLLTQLASEGDPRSVRQAGPCNGYFLAHTLGVRDMRVWLEVTARNYKGHRVERWHDGEDAAIGLGPRHVPATARPDAWFVYRLGSKVLVGLLEYDRGTERGTERWKSKISSYCALFAGDQLRTVTGYVNARILVLTPDERRRERLSDLISANAPGDLSARFWLATRSVLDRPVLAEPAWGQPGSRLLRPLFSKELLDAR